MPGLVDFFQFAFASRFLCKPEIGAPAKKVITSKAGIALIDWMRKPVDEEFARSKRFTPSTSIYELAEKAEQVLSVSNNMGEGWLLTAEMIELIESGTPNIVCCSPFACLPNHVVGKAVIKELRRQHPDTNIVAVDYDPGASEVNQLNRIKLMISVAKEKFKETGRGPAK